MSGLIWVQTVCNGYQTTLVDKELKSIITPSQSSLYKIEVLWLYYPVLIPFESNCISQALRRITKFFGNVFM